MRTDITEQLEQAKTIAVIGCSASEYRTSYQIASYLKKHGYTVIPINPNYEEVLGEKCYNSITDVDADTPVDIVNIFRNRRYTAEMVEGVIEWVEKSGRKPLIWTQLNVSSEEAEALAGEAGLPYVKNRCIMVEHSQRI